MPSRNVSLPAPALSFRHRANHTVGKASRNKTLPARSNWFILLSSNFVLVAKKKSLPGHDKEMSQHITSAEEEA
jgi:hypothetical protein